MGIPEEGNPRIVLGFPREGGPYYHVSLLLSYKTRTHEKTTRRAKKPTQAHQRTKKTNVCMSRARQKIRQTDCPPTDQPTNKQTKQDTAQRTRHPNMRTSKPTNQPTINNINNKTPSGTKKNETKSSHVISKQPYAAHPTQPCLAQPNQPTNQQTATKVLSHLKILKQVIVYSA